jgi:hypothetical protein
MAMRTTSSHTPKVVGVFVLSSMMLIGVYVFLVRPEIASIDNSTILNVPMQTTGAATNSPLVAPNTKLSTVPESPTPASTPTKPTTTYKNGTYSQTTRYTVPGEINSISATIIVENDTVVSVVTSHEYGGRESIKYITGFDASISSQIVGTKLSDAKPSRIGGASLTTTAFNQAIAAVMSEAAY